jgi:alpha-mannosidase
VDTDPAFRSLYPYPVIGVFGKGWDDLKTLTDEFVTVARAKTNASRKVIVSDQLDFFRDFESSHGSDLPAMSVGFGNEWDLYSASLSEVSARVRRAVEGLRAAEGLGTLVALERPGFWSSRETAREQAWMNLGVYWEHNWTSDSPVISREARAAWQRRLAAQIEGYVETLHDDAAYALGDLIRGGGEHPRFFVFNPLSWTRTDVADLPLDGGGEVHVVDLVTGKAVPSQVVHLRDPAYLKGKRFARALAAEIPPVGYRVFEVRPGPAPALDDAAVVAFPVAAQGGVLENDRFRIEVEPRGAVGSWIDKAAGGRELVRAVDGRSLNDLGPGDGVLSVENAGPVSVTLVARTEGPPARETRITLLRDSPRVEIHNEITENFAGVESWAFGFDLDSPDVWHEEVGAVIRARLLGDGGHYAETNARLDWLTLNHFAAISGADGRGVTLSNADTAFMRLGRSALVDGRSRLDVDTPQISVLAGGQVDGPTLGIPAQGGDSRFLQRFALAPHDGFDPAWAMRFALEHQSPLVAGRVRGGNVYPGETFSLLGIDNPDVLLWSLKPAEEGIDQGIVARVWNLAAQERPFSLGLAPGIENAVQTTHIETDRSAVPVSEGVLSATAARSQLLTYRLWPGASRE